MARCNKCGLSPISLCHECPDPRPPTRPPNDIDKLRMRLDLLCEAMVFLIERTTRDVTFWGPEHERASLLERLKDG
jgi:hypothetical protein